MIWVYTKKFETSKRFKPKQSLPIVLELLSDYLKRPVSSSEIIYSSEGKPSLKDNSISFSVSHSDRFLAVACSREVKVGLDIQTQMPVSEGVINSTVTEKEKAQEQWLRKEVQFLDVWCIKEAALKWIGSGLKEPLTDLELSFQSQVVDAGKYGILRYAKLNLFPEVKAYLVFDKVVNLKDIAIK